MALGVSDGILNALTLASAAVLRGVGLSLNVSVRVGIVAFTSAVLTVFVAEYTQNRSELARAERQLMFTRSGRLAATALGRAVFRESAVTAAIAGSSSFGGAALPLVIGTLLPQVSWIAVLVSGVILGGLGMVLAGHVGGSRFVWAAGLVATGIAGTIIGMKVDLVP